jgi:mono/diheme cytochrome c family protein
VSFRSASIPLLFLMAVSRPQGLGAQAGPSDRLRPNAQYVQAGRQLYARGCINCHGLDVKGTEDGPDLIRSVAVLRDTGGNAIGPAMAAVPDHPELSDTDLRDMSHFLREQVELTSRNRNPTTPPDVLTGRADAGRRFFDGEGGCSGCHSPTGDLAGIGASTSPVNLQQRILFPRSGRETPSQVTVRFPAGTSVSGTLGFLDDFFVSLTDAEGNYRSFRRVGGIVVDVEDPYQAHWDLLERISDQNIHDLVTYLETLR